MALTHFTAHDGPEYGGPLLPPGKYTFTPNVTAARHGV
jgi:hypothetical protein